MTQKSAKRTQKTTTGRQGSTGAARKRKTADQGTGGMLRPDFGGGAELRDALSHHEIAAQAYIIWQQRGCPFGQAEEIWFAAERVLAQAQQEP